jgi:hypothetical protein
LIQVKPELRGALVFSKGATEAPTAWIEVAMERQWSRVFRQPYTGPLMIARQSARCPVFDLSQ